MTTVNVSLVRQVETAVSLRGPAGIPGPAGGIPIYAADPVSPTDGLVYYNSTSGTVRYYTNAEGWQQLLEAGDNAVSASRWETARTLLLDGDASGSVVLDGSADVTLTVTVPELGDKADTASLGSAAFAATTDFDPAGAAAAAQSAAEATAAGGLAAHHSPTSTDHDDRYTPTASLADVATSGAYSDLSGAPTLGSAAATDASDYATAAQGAKADNAVQLTGETTQQVDGNLEVLGGVSAGYGQELSAPGPGRISTGGDLDVAGHADVGDYLNANEVHAFNDMTLDGNRVAIVGHDHNGENLYPQTVDASTHIQLQGQDVVVQPQLTAHHAPTSADHDDRYTPTSQLADVATSGDYTDLAGTPTLGTAAPLNVPAAGDAAASEVVKGDDTRLSDARTPTAHTHPATDISDSTVTGRAVVTAVDAAAARAAIGAGTGSSDFDGSYASLTGKPTLGTAADNAETDFAAAAHDHDGDYDPAGAAAAAVAGHEASHAPADAITAADHALIDHTGLPGVGSGGGGAVDSVNGETGVVVLDAADVGADPAGAAAAAQSAAEATSAGALAAHHASGSTDHDDRYTPSTDLAAVATTGAYSDLSGTPTLGTAADNDEGDFATAAQGALADTAVQPADLDARVPDPSGEADGRMLEVASGALVYADAPSGGSGPDPTGATAGHVWTADGADGANWAAPATSGPVEYNIDSATASTEYSGNVASRACDGDTGTFWWSSGQSAASWIMFDLGEAKAVDTITVQHLDSDRPTHVDVEWSDDTTDGTDGTWIEVLGVEAISAGETVLSFAQATGRYWRLSGYGVPWWKLHEVAISGTTSGGSGPDPTGATANYVWTADGEGGAEWRPTGGLSLPMFGMAGDLSVGAGDTRWYNDSGATINITTARATVVTAPVGADLVVSLAVDSVEADTVTVPDGSTTAKETVTVAIPADSYLTVDITQVGSTTAGADLLVTMIGA